MKKNRLDNLREKYMDGEVLFKSYYEMGDAKTFGRLVNMVERMTGTRPTAMGVWKSMWRWASLKENRRKAWEIYKTSDDLTYEEFLVILVEKLRKAWQHNTNAKFKKFLRDNGYEVEYIISYSDGTNKSFDDLDLARGSKGKSINLIVKEK